MKQLSAEQINKFINDGFIKIENAFPQEVADECRAILWKSSQCDPLDARTWIHPVVRIGELGLAPFKKAADTQILHAAFNELAGDNWIPRETLGSFPIRFPGKEPAPDTGWHVDASFPVDDMNDYLQWRINVRSRGRALLMLFLFSDVAEKDAPTVIKIGSHSDVAKLLEPHGDNGLSFMELAKHLPSLRKHEEAFATGKAGTVYLCHPFIVHAAQNHYGTNPRFMAQPPLQTKHDFNIDPKKKEHCPIEIAIIKGLQK